MLRRDADENEIQYWAQRLGSDLSVSRLVKVFLESEEFRKHLTKPFAAPGHFYSPIVDAVEADKYLRELESQGTPESLPGIELDREAMVRTWRQLLPFMQSLPFAERPGSGFRYGFVNPYYSWGDGSILHAMIRLHRPQRIIEIGSGWSSACIADTAKHFLDGNCELTFIEPYPERLREVLGTNLAEERIRALEYKVQDVPLEVFDALQTHDILFIDSTHVLKTGSDVCRELCEILPRLAAGVLVHFHDMFWPFEYPKAWVVDENRSWNELYAVRVLLAHSRNWHVVLFNQYMAKLERRLIETTYPHFYKNPGGALWIERR